MHKSRLGAIIIDCQTDELDECCEDLKPTAP